jgi:hypothetical protein
VTNPKPSEPFPPPPRSQDNSQAARMARMVKYRLRFLAVFFVIGAVLLAVRNYPAGALMLGFAVVRAGMLGWRVRTMRRRAREWGGP